MANRLLKHMAIARSGVYLYRREELPSLGITSIPQEYSEYVAFGVYRPATVLSKRADLFKSLPVTLEHPGIMLNPSNVDYYMEGYTGDQVVPVYDSKTGEVFLISSMTLVTAKVMQAYDEGIREVSPGYTPKVIWAKGQHNGEEYQLMVTDITDANHLAIVRQARGGSSTCIIDSEGGNSMKGPRFFSGLWRFLKKKVNGASDTDLGAARRILAEIAEKKDAMTDEEITAKVDEVITMAGDLPDSDEKGKLLRFLEDFKQSKLMDPAAVKEAAEMIATLFEELDTKAMAEVTGVGVKEPVEESQLAAEETSQAKEETAPQETAVSQEEPAEESAGQTTLTEPAQYVPGLEKVGEDGCSDEDIKGFLGSLKGKKISPKQALYILQELLVNEPQETVPVTEEPASEDSSQEVPPKEEPAAGDSTAEESSQEDEAHAEDSFGITATFRNEGGDNHGNKSLAAFFSENFGVKERI